MIGDVSRETAFVIDFAGETNLLNLPSFHHSFSPLFQLLHDVSYIDAQRSPCFLTSCSVTPLPGNGKRGATRRQKHPAARRRRDRSVSGLPERCLSGRCSERRAPQGRRAASLPSEDAGGTPAAQGQVRLCQIALASGEAARKECSASKSVHR